MILISRQEAIKKGLTKYYNGNHCPKGHLSERFVSNYKCCECRKAYNDDTSEHRFDYIRRNKQQIYARAKKYRDENREHVAMKKKIYNSKNTKVRRDYYIRTKERYESYRKEYRLNNRESISKACKRWRLNNPLNTLTRRSLERIERSTSCKHVTVAEVELGYTQDEFKRHIESLFEEGMTWNNRSEWHIDHVIPISWWLKEGITDVSIINSLINLQPLWASDNLSKGSDI